MVRFLRVGDSLCIQISVLQQSRGISYGLAAPTAVMIMMRGSPMGYDLFISYASPDLRFVEALG